MRSSFHMKVLRGLVIVLMLIAAGAVLAFGSREEKHAPAAFTKVQYWEKWTGEEARQMRQIVDEFNNTVGQEKHIYVEYLSMSTVDQKTLVATAAGVPPDVAGVWDGQLVQFAAMDALEPLDELAAEHGITPSLYKPIYWQACQYKGKLWGLISTPAAIGLHYNKELFEQGAAKLRAEGLDPERPPRTMQEMDRYADALTTYEMVNGRKRIKISGHLPLEPDWYLAELSYWHGGGVYDAEADRLDLQSPPSLAAFERIANYSRKYGKASITEFRSGLGTFASSQNPFLSGVVVMEQQGPWMSNYIDVLAPQMNRWHVPPEKVAREKNFARLAAGMTLQEVTEILGAPASTQGAQRSWDAGIKTITCTFSREQKLSEFRMDYLPALERRKYCQWAAAPFPSAVAGLDNVAFCSFDVLVIPRGCKHKREAFEFIAFVNRQDVMEHLCAMHCKNSPLAKVSRQFIDYHPNPYIQVFEDLAASPNAFAVPRLPVWPEVANELTVAAQKCYLLEQTPGEALRVASERCNESWSYFKDVQQLRGKR